MYNGGVYGGVKFCNSQAFNLHTLICKLSLLMLSCYHPTGLITSLCHVYIYLPSQCRTSMSACNVVAWYLLEVAVQLFAYRIMSVVRNRDPVSTRHANITLNNPACWNHITVEIAVCFHDKSTSHTFLAIQRGMHIFLEWECG